MEATTEQVKKTYPEGTVFTMLKFELSEKDHSSYIGYVSQNTKTGKVNGVRVDSHYPKRVCIVDAKINYLIIPGVLYRVTLIPMKSKQGYIVIEAEPYQFKATIKTNYIPKILYQVEVCFGQRKIVFDPLDGRKSCRNSIKGVAEQLSKRFDIMDLQSVIAEFEIQANNLINNFIKDGCYKRVRQAKAIAKAEAAS